MELRCDVNKRLEGWIEQSRMTTSASNLQLQEGKRLFTVSAVCPSIAGLSKYLVSTS